MKLLNNLSIIERHGKVYSDQVLQEYGLGFSEFKIMMYLWECDQVSQDMIARHYQVDKGTITKTLQKLEEKGFVQRVENPENKREKLVSATAFAKEQATQMKGTLELWHNQLFQEIDKKELEVFIKVADKMAENALFAVSQLEVQRRTKE